MMNELLVKLPQVMSVLRDLQMEGEDLLALIERIAKENQEMAQHIEELSQIIVDLGGGDVFENDESDNESTEAVDGQSKPSVVEVPPPPPPEQQSAGQPPLTQIQSEMPPEVPPVPQTPENNVVALPRPSTQMLPTELKAPNPQYKFKDWEAMHHDMSKVHGNGWQGIISLNSSLINAFPEDEPTQREMHRVYSSGHNTIVGSVNLNGRYMSFTKLMIEPVE
jgi:hypothetical protein